jgi:hypothetical protein
MPRADEYDVLDGCRYCAEVHDCDETCDNAREAKALALAPWLSDGRARPYLEGVAALVWRWRAEAELTEGALSGCEIAAVLRECADELANSIPAHLVAEAGRSQNKSGE